MGPGGGADKAACRKVRHGASGHGEETVAGISEIARPLKMRLGKPKLSFLHYPLSSMNYFANYSQAHHRHFNGLGLDDMSPAHASTKTKKEKTKEVPFHIRHRTKLTPFT